MAWFDTGFTSTPDPSNPAILSNLMLKSLQQPQGQNVFGVAQPSGGTPTSFTDTGGPQGSAQVTTSPFLDPSLGGGPQGSPQVGSPTPDPGTTAVNIGDAPPPGPTPGGLDQSQLNKTIQSIYAQYGKTPSADDLAYWGGFYNQWNDPAYWDSRLRAGLAGNGGGGGGPVSSVVAPQPVNFAPFMAATVQNNPQLQSLIDTLLGRASESLNVNPNDPIIKGQTDNYAAAQERQLRNGLSAVAESQGPNANLSAQTLAANETAAQNDATFSSQVMQNELTARRTEIQNALTEAGSLLTASQQVALQEELAKLDAAIAQAQLQQQSYQFDVSSQFRAAGL